MKTFLIRLSFLPFVLAIFWGAKTMWEQIQSPEPSATVQNLAQTETPTVQLALALDISGSMNGLIDQAQSRLWKLINELAITKVKGQTPRLEIALYVYGGDHLSPERGFVRQLTSFTTDLDLLSEQLFSLNTNGGEEYCGAVLQATLRELAWREDPETLKLLFIAGNEAFNQGTIDYQEVCKEAAQKGILLNTIFCGPFSQGRVLEWEKGAVLGGGQYLSIDHNLELEDAPTPYDEQFDPLNTALNETYLYYGEEGSKLAARMFYNDANNARQSQSAACDRASAKANGAFRNSLSWDLVEASKADDFSWENLDYKTLPENCKDLQLEELKALVAERRLERQRIQKEIVALTKLRSEYLSNIAEEGAERLDDALLQCLHKQAGARGYIFEAEAE